MGVDSNRPGTSGQSGGRITAGGDERTCARWIVINDSSRSITSYVVVLVHQGLFKHFICTRAAADVLAERQRSERSPAGPQEVLVDGFCEVRLREKPPESF